MGWLGCDSFCVILFIAVGKVIVIQVFPRL